MPNRNRAANVQRRMTNRLGPMSGWTDNQMANYNTRASGGQARRPGPPKPPQNTLGQPSAGGRPMSDWDRANSLSGDPRKGPGMGGKPPTVPGGILPSITTLGRPGMDGGPLTAPGGVPGMGGIPPQMGGMPGMGGIPPQMGGSPGMGGGGKGGGTPGITPVSATPGGKGGVPMRGGGPGIAGPPQYF